jgi:hypothetical protein
MDALQKEEEATAGLGSAESAPVHSGGSLDAFPIEANYTRAQEARVVRKLDLNLMTLFFVLCKWPRQ